MRTEIDGLTIYYEQHGSPESPQILLLHGWGSSVDAFRLLIRDFQDRFFLTAVDFPGFGQSDMIPRPWDAADYARFVQKFIRQAGLENPVLIGHSHGGRTILKLVGEGLYAPPKIILMDAAGLTSKRTLRQTLRLYTYKSIKGTLSLPGIRRFSGGLLERARGHFGSADYKDAPPVLRNTLVRLVNEDLRPVLPRIPCPTLLIWGDQDKATPLSHGQEMARAIPDAGLCVIRGAGHFSFVERPYEVHRILESFLGG